MSQDTTTGFRFGRRGFLAGTVALGGALVAAGCTNQEDTPAAQGSGDGAASSEPGKQVTIGFSAPGADHGWLAAITKNARAAADQHEDVELVVTEGNSTSAEQIGQIETLINRKPNVLVILPQEGQALTAVSQKAMDAGIPVVNLDRIFSSPLAYRTWVGGDNYGMGVAAGHYIGRNLEQGRIVEIQGIAALELTKQRSQGFADALKSYPQIEVVARQAADFTPDTGERVMANVLQAQPEIDAVWNHDDDQGVGVEAAIRNAGREDELWMVGGAGTKAVMEKIKAGDLYRATVLYSPIMSGTAINLARLVGQGRGLSETWEKEVPASITLYSSTVTKDNVDQYLDLGF